ncbi:hypothetical protein Pmani_019758 [Petrolisthes manimaculis]|uniref:Alpha-1,3-mannosyl-glycoprotein 2-beta-N-acetylglucosaminyltransferase n=1 Tax=Petrolisthes manimaculis TaxID=1843537 RepID=A0AAE1U388_9EUCA|nr:hypothetical protein Pmani_019758 [Petrolisthes manimaculis]
MKKSETEAHQYTDAKYLQTKQEAPPKGQEHTQGDTLEITGLIDNTGATVWIQGRQVYSLHNKLETWAGEPRRFHAGVHVLVLHEAKGHVMASELFLTWQPAAHKMLAAMLSTLQKGRLVICIGAPDSSIWLLNEGLRALYLLGARLSMKGVRGEAWVMAAYTPGTPLYESLISIKNSTALDSSPLAFSISLPRRQERRCPWHDDPGMASRAVFCEKYERYGQFCDCDNPLYLNPHQAVSPIPPIAAFLLGATQYLALLDVVHYVLTHILYFLCTQPPLKLYEVIPVALVTARRLHLVLRQIRQIWENPGGADTPLVMMVDGANPEALSLASILNITVRFHNNSAPLVLRHRVNQHIKFSLGTIFNLYPDVNKAIILEDDLNLSPDFIRLLYNVCDLPMFLRGSYFQQTSILMNADQTIVCVNAYNYNSFPHTASDPSRIYRVQSYPYYGWMTSRAHATRFLSDWAPIDLHADWDLYLRRMHVDENNEVIIPEVPRTKHEGGAGVHVTGLEQETSYNQRPLNTQQHVILDMRRMWDLAYAVDMMWALLGAKVVTVNQHPCIHSPIPKYKPNRTHVIYMNVSGEYDEANSYAVLGKCLGFYHQGLYEHYRGTYSLKYFTTPFILVSCYSSVYCDSRRVSQSLVYTPTKEDLIYANKHPWRHSNESAFVVWRIPPESVGEEVSLNNIKGYEILINE